MKHILRLLYLEYLFAQDGEGKSSYTQKEMLTFFKEYISLLTHPKEKS